jgi:hypothetical protein
MMVLHDGVAGSEAFAGREDSIATEQHNFSRSKVAEQILEHNSRFKKPIDVVFQKESEAHDLLLIV